MKSQPKIIAYMKPQCGWSNGVRAILKKYQLEYDDRDIINNANNYAEMVRKSGQPLQPTLEIGEKIIADVSGEELEAWLIKEGVVSSNQAPVEVPINSACTDEQHARQRETGWTPPISIKS